MQLSQYACIAMMEKMLLSFYSESDKKNYFIGLICAFRRFRTYLP